MGRQRVLRTMNFIEEELVLGLRFVYPADSAQRKICGGNIGAYVYTRGGGQEKGYCCVGLLKTPSCGLAVWIKMGGISSTCVRHGTRWPRRAIKSPSLSMRPLTTRGQGM